MARCPGYDEVNVKPMTDEEHVRLTAMGTARQYHLAAAHPHLFCGCGTEATTCHPTRCCRDDEYGTCTNCGRVPDIEPEPIPEDELSEPLFEIGGA